MPRGLGSPGPHSSAVSSASSPLAALGAQGNLLPHVEAQGARSVRLGGHANPLLGQLLGISQRKAFAAPAARHLPTWLLRLEARPGPGRELPVVLPQGRSERGLTHGACASLRLCHRPPLPGHVPRGPGRLPSMPQAQPGAGLPLPPSPVSPLLSVSVKGKSSSPLRPGTVSRLRFRLGAWGLVTRRHGLTSSRRSEAWWQPPEWAVTVSRAWPEESCGPQGPRGRLPTGELEEPTVNSQPCQVVDPWTKKGPELKIKVE